MTRLSVFTSSKAPLTKRFYLVNGTIQKDALATFHTGRAETRDVTTPAALMALLDGLTPKQALSTGVLKVGVAADITTAAKARDGGVARTLEHFHYPKAAGWLLWDYDAKTMPPEVERRIEDLGGPVAALFHIWPEAMAAPYVIRPSSSGGVSAPGCAELESNGLHGFFLIEDVSRSKEALETLQARAWAAGLAWAALSKSGALLIRSIVDVTVGSPERLIFEAPPIFAPPVIRRPKPAVVSDAVVPVAVPVIDLETAARAAWAESEARRKIQPEAVRVETAFVEDRAKADAAKTGRTVAQSRVLIRQMLRGGVLSDDHLLELRDGSVARVGDLLDAPDRYDRVSLPDPIEGLSYGPDKATLLLRADPRHPDVEPRLVSHAHGSTTVYRFQRYETPSPVPVASVGPATRPAAARPEVLEVGEARARLQSEVRDGLRRTGVTLIEATLGLGKTRATIAELENRLAEAREAGIEEPAAVVAVPMHRLGRQVLADIKAAAPGVSVVQLYGAEAQDPDDLTSTVCKRLDEYKGLASLLLDTAPLCEACPFAASCLHLSSKAEKADIYVTSHEPLKNARPPIKAGQTLVATVVDESPMNALVNDKSRAVPLAAMLAAPVKIRTKAGEMERLGAEADLRAFREKLEDLICAHGPGDLRLSDLSKWTATDARAAYGLEWQRKVNDETDPEVKGNKTLTILSGIYTEIQRSIEEEVEVNARVHIREGEMGLEVVLSGLKPISAGYRKAPVLMLDATAEADLAGMLAGEPIAHHATIRARENIVIEQDPNLTGAKTFFFAGGKPTRNVARVRRYIEMEAMDGRTVAISNKETVVEMSLPGHIQAAHFNALRGLNDFSEADTLVVVGRTLPSPQALRRMVAAIWGTPCVGTVSPDGKVWRLVEHEGRLVEAETKTATHEDPRAQTLLTVIRDAEVVQAVGRLRAVNRGKPVRCVILSDAVIDYPVRLVDLRGTLWACDVMGKMLERGVAFLSPSHASGAYPDLYKDRQAADQVFKRLTDLSTFSIRGLYGKRCQVVTVRRPRGQMAMAMAHPSISDIDAMIKTLIPDAEVKRIECPSEEQAVQPAKVSPVAAPAVVDIKQARNARADQTVEEYFTKALALVDKIRAGHTVNASPPSGRKVAAGGSVAVAVETRPEPRLVWMLEADPKPRLLPPVLRRYAVTEAGVRLVWDRATDDTARGGADLVLASVAAWQGMTETDPEAWA